jgi:phosphate transport system protein
MSMHLQREIDKIKAELLSLCTLVENQVQMAIGALFDRNHQRAQEVENGDKEVDQREIEVEENCLKTLALHQPVARDLRLIVAALKINNDLERIGDLAVNIAHKAAALSSEPALEISADIGGMWQKTRTMLHDSLMALVNLDARLAREVCTRDDEVDQIKREARLVVEETVRQNPERVKPLLRLLAVFRNLERIADCATNIAEDVIYMVEGKIIRHHAQDN